jgi:hypothetical protein
MKRKTDDGRSHIPLEKEPNGIIFRGLDFGERKKCEGTYQKEHQSSKQVRRWTLLAAIVSSDCGPCFVSTTRKMYSQERQRVKEGAEVECRSDAGSSGTSVLAKEVPLSAPALILQGNASGYSLRTGSRRFITTDT